MSGLSCAARLFESGIYRSGKKSLIVLEGRARIGGRIGAVHINGNRLDTGANWIHGTGTLEEPNPLMKILPENRLKYRPLNANVSFRAPKRRRVSTNTTLENDDISKGIGEPVHGQAHPPSIHGIPDTREDDWTMVGSKGKTEPRPGEQTLPQLSSSGDTTSEDLVIPTQPASRLFAMIFGIIEALHEKAAAATPMPEIHGVSLLDTIRTDEGFQTAFKQLPHEYHSTLQGLPQFLENMEGGPLQIESAIHGAIRPGLSLSEFAIDDFDGDQVFLRDGYLALIEQIAENLLEGGIVKLGSQVQSIDWSGEHIILKTSDDITYAAQKVICTLPLGVLQYHTAEKQTAPRSTPAQPTSPTVRTDIFDPPLPDARQEAIRSLGFGLLDKIFLVYNHTWWKDEPFSGVIKKGLTQLEEGELEEPDTFWGFTSDLPGLAVSEEGVEAGPRVMSVLNLNALTGFPVLAAYISCRNAIHVESLSDAAAASIVHRALSKWLGHPPPKPSAVHVTRWHQDPFARGSYTHMVTNLSLTRHREELSEPIVNGHGRELRFAGEHTSRNHFATVHGALLSGWREADAVLRAECAA